MSRQFHNLDGVLRDIIAAFDDEAEGWDRLCDMCRIIGTVLEYLEGDSDSDLPDAEPEAGRSSDDGLGVPDGGSSSSVAGDPARHASVRPAPVGGARGVPAPVERAARASALAAAGARGTGGPMVPTRGRSNRRVRA